MSKQTKQVIDWSDIVGNKKVGAGGFIGDMLDIALVYLDKAKTNGQLKESDVGSVIAQIIPSVIQVAANFELEAKRTEQELIFREREYKLKEDETNNRIRIAKSEHEINKKTAQQKLNEASLDKKLKEQELKKIGIELSTMKDENKFKLEGLKNSIAIQKQELNIKKKDLALKEQDIKLKQSQNKLAATQNKIEEEKLKLSSQNLKLEKEKLEADKDRIKYATLSIQNDIENKTKRTSAEIELLNTQAKGFRDNAKQQLLKSSIDGYAMLFDSSDILRDTNSIPDIFKSKGIDNIAKKMFEEYGIPTSGVFN